MNWGNTLAGVNATLNGLCFILLFLGWRFIKSKNIRWHRNMMGTAFAVSVIFLISYLTRFYLTGVHRYSGTGLMKQVYLTILLTHTVLAATVPFLAIRTLYLALKNRIEAHKKIAKITLPIWMYVSVTGVIVYLMLYHF